jgi:predicted dithiol-disulfide oxidoreductase (DUF899 family)
MHTSARSVCRVSEATRGAAAAEIESMQHTERVAPLRRQLPAGPVVEDYAFQEGPRDLDAGDSPVSSARLSDLFSGPG